MVFWLKASLSSHQKKNHLPPKKSKCNLCGKEMLNRLGRHMKNVHKSYLIFKCDICEKSFRDGLRLKYHKLAVHKIELEWIVRNYLHTIRLLKLEVSFNKSFFHVHVVWFLLRSYTYYIHLEMVMPEFHACVNLGLFYDSK